jgi:hypothetical protein
MSLSRLVSLAWEPAGEAVAHIRNTVTGRSHCGDRKGGDKLARSTLVGTHVLDLLADALKGDIVEIPMISGKIKERDDCKYIGEWAVDREPWASYP